MYRVKLTQISSNHNHVRTKTIEGHCINHPKIGKRFIMFAKPLDAYTEAGIPTAFRFFESSLIQEVWNVPPDLNTIHFKTLNSYYTVTLQ